MYDIYVIFSNLLGLFGVMGMVLGNNGVGFEGGGVFIMFDVGYVYFLVEDGEIVCRVLIEVGFMVSNVCCFLI